MFKQEIVIKQVLKNILSKDEQPQNTLRRWQLYRGLTIEILTELEHSGGMTTRDISTRINKTCDYTSNKLCKMLRGGLVERIEKWGWRITRDGINLININYSPKPCTNPTRTIPTPYPNDNNTFPLENQKAKKEEHIPGCFHEKFCHIRRISKNKIYDDKTSRLCDGCVWFKSTAWTGTQDSKGNVG